MNITIKNNWNEVTIEEFLRLESLKKRDIKDNATYLIEVLSILSDKDKDFLENMPAVNLPGCAEALKFITTQPSGAVKKEYEINGKVYTARLNTGDLTAMQYIDLAALIKNNEGNKNLHNILAVLLVPKGMKYNSGKYDVMALGKEIKKYFSIADAFAISLFFSIILNILIDLTKSYSIKKMRRAAEREKCPERKEALMMMMKEMRRSRRSGVGYTASISQQRQWDALGDTCRTYQ